MAEALFGRTVWSETSTARIDVNGKAKRLVFEDKDGMALAIFFRAGGKWEFRAVDAWAPDAKRRNK
ncbi:MAG: hypothetical protein PHI85_08890 [Victivallaceae bacterium]|nr:hypothetical protein [Victivallaceae bacterium]